MKHVFRISVTASVLILMGVAIFAQTTDYFTDYPGGSTEVHYQITTSALSNPIELSWIIAATEGQELIVTTTNRVVATPEDLEVGVLNGIAEAQLIIQSESVRALLENPRNLTPNSSFIVPGGAQFQTASNELILGIEVICGILTNSDDPEERILLAITEDPTLPFPPFIRKELVDPGSSDGSSIPLTVCESLEPLISSTQNHTSEFVLHITQFDRSE